MVKPLNLGPAAAKVAPMSPPVIDAINFTPAPNNPIAVRQPSQVPANTKPLTLDEIAGYGAKGSTEVGQVVDRLASMGRMNDMEEIGQMMGNLLVTAKGYDPDAPYKSGGIMGFLVSKKQQLQNRFDSVNTGVDRLLQEVDLKIKAFLQQVKDCEAMGEANLARYRQFQADEAALLERIAWAEANAPVVDPNDAMSANILSDYNSMLDRARLKASNLKVLQVTVQQLGVQIAFLRNNAIALADKFGSVKTLTVPQLKQSFVIAVLNAAQAKGAKLATDIDDVTNAAMIKNAQGLRTNTTAIHTALNRSIVDLSTLQTCNQALIDTVGDIQRIRDETQQRLIADAPRLEQLSRDLATAVMNR